MDVRNLFAGYPADRGREAVEPLVENGRLRLERIVSFGQATPPGEWYDQERDEWVVLLSGEALLAFEGDAEPLRLRPGDHLLIPAHRRHRVVWTAPGAPTVWLALHYA